MWQPRTPRTRRLRCLAWGLVACAIGGCGGGGGSGQNVNGNENENHGVAVCGNGVREGLEECDDGEENSDSRPDACRSTCELPRCGDGVKDAGEACDDGSRNSDTSPNTCRRSCTLPRCGDQVVDDAYPYDEECDDGNTAPGDGCGPTCRLERCGNGYLDAGEECDDGNTAPNDGCGPTCLFERCGNGYLDPGEACDAGQYNGLAQASPCRPDCTLPYCGDGIRNGEEQCDHGSANSDTLPNACRTGCLRAHCGDGVLDAGEVCDDGTALPTATCSMDCKSDRSCGNGILDPETEECDAGIYNSWVPNAPCRPGCLAVRCGDGIVDTGLGEECDAGAENSDTLPGRCREDCLPARCGDGVLDPGEECDDGNDFPDDGCGPTCQFEFGWNCEPTPLHSCVACPPYRHGPACDRCAVLVNLTSPAATGDGATWYTAFRTLQEGIDMAASQGEDCDVWAAEGVYLIYQGSSLNDTVQMRSGVSLYGGFGGFETSREKRDWRGRKTILDGADPITNDRVNNVVRVEEVTKATLDGVTIRRGNAVRVRNVGEPWHSGGGIFASNYGQLVIRNSEISYNVTAHFGAGIYSTSNDGQLLITNCRIINNHAGSGGGGIMAERGGLHTIRVHNSIIAENSGNYRAGGIAFIWWGQEVVNLVVSNSVIARNYNQYAGYGAFTNNSQTRIKIVGSTIAFNGGLGNTGTGYLSVKNTIVWSNGSGSLNANELVTSTVGVDPKFVSSDNLRLQPTSPCIDQGTDVGASPTDLEGKRRLGPTDIGAYEYGGEPSSLVEGTHEGLYFASRVAGEERTWEDAEILCATHGGHLVAIGSSEENAFLSRLLLSPDGAWIGATDALFAGSWSWSSGETFGYARWAAGEPDGIAGQSCGVLGAEDGAWSAEACSEPRHFICEQAW